MDSDVATRGRDALGCGLGARMAWAERRHRSTAATSGASLLPRFGVAVESLRRWTGVVSMRPPACADRANHLAAVLAPRVLVCSAYAPVNRAALSTAAKTRSLVPRSVATAASRPAVTASAPAPNNA